MQEENGTFRIFFFPEDNSAVNYYKYDSSWTDFLNHTDISDIFISEKDIETYHWKEQRIYLNESGNQKIIRLKERVKKTSTHYEKISVSMIPLQGVKFMIALKEQRIYAGTLHFIASAAGILHPVIYYDYPLKENNTGTVFTMRPIGMGGSWGNEPQNKIILNENVKDHFSRLHKLELD